MSDSETRAPSQGAPAEGAPPNSDDHVAPRVVRTIAAISGAWILVMAAIVLAAGPHAAAAGGWRLALLKQGAITAFTVALIGATVAAALVAARAPRRSGR